MKDQKIKNESCGYFSVSKMLENGIHVAVQNFMGTRRISDQYSKILENVIYIYISHQSATVDTPFLHYSIS